MARKTYTQPAKSKPIPRKVVKAGDLNGRTIRGRYDAASKTNENANLWSNTDSLSAAQANSPSVRKIIRDRARYEVANNSYAAGIVKTLANDVIGPKIQIQLGNSPDQQQAELDFSAWAKATGLFAKLRTMRKAKTTDGESFAQMFTNPFIENDIKLDILLLECDMIEGYFLSKDSEIDGIKFDRFNNPISYRVLTSHPGDYRNLKSLKTAGTWIKRKFILHYFDSDRPGQVRGVSEIVAPLSLFGQVRQYTAAVVTTATRAAEISGIIKTNLLPDGEAAVAFDEPAVTIDIGRNELISIPDGWDMAQFKAEQPTDTYKEFKAEIINEAARCLNMPANVAMGNSSGYNYASGRLDFQTYDRSIDVDRDGLERDVLDRIYRAWLEEYAQFKALNRTIEVSLLSPLWFYSGRGHVDPKKEADADNSRLNNGTLTKGDYWAEQGQDAQRKEEQRIEEMIIGEVMWNKAREKAELDPAPYPYTSAIETTQVVEVIDNE